MIKYVRIDILTHFFLHNIYTEREIKEKKIEMKKKNITKLPMCIFCVRKLCQNIISQDDEIDVIIVCLETK
jgi:3-oxoacyl-[acyl-carrier-protein] synthase III